MTAKGTLCKFKLAKDLPSLACPYYYCEKIHDRMCEQHRSKLAQTGLCAPYCLPSFKKTIHSRNKMVYKQIGTRNRDGPKSSIWQQRVPCTDGNSEQNSPKLSIWEQCVPFTDRNSEQNSPKLSIWEPCVP